MRNASVGAFVVSVLFVGMATREAPAGQGQASSQVQMRTSGQGGQSGASVTFTPAKVMLLRTVDCEGNVDYQTCKDAESAEKKQKKLADQYDKAFAWRQKTDANLTKQGLKNDRVAPVQPIVDVVKKNVAKADATAAIRDAKDCAVYEIAVAGNVKRIVSYAHSDAFAKALADAEFGRVYNQWVKDGKKDGQEPKPATVTKIGAALDKAQAEKALAAKTTTGNAG